MKQGLVRLLYNFGKRFMGWTLHMMMCVLLCYPVSIRVYYQQGVLFLVYILVHIERKDILHKLQLCQCELYFYNALCLFPAILLWNSIKSAELDRI